LRISCRFFFPFIIFFSFFPFYFSRNSSPGGLAPSGIDDLGSLQLRFVSLLCTRLLSPFFLLLFLLGAPSRFIEDLPQPWSSLDA